MHAAMHVRDARTTYAPSPCPLSLLKCCSRTNPRRAACTRSARRRRHDGTACTWPSTTVHTGAGAAGGRVPQQCMHGVRSWRVGACKSELGHAIVKGWYDGTGPSRRGVTAHFHFGELRGVHPSYLGRTLFPLGVSVFDSVHLFGALSFALCTMQQIFICEREGASCYIVDQ